MPTPRTGRVERHGNRWRFQVYVDGQRIRQSFATYAEAAEGLRVALDAVARDGQTRLARQLGQATVADVVSLYYERRRPHLELSTQARYDNVIEKYVLPGLGPLDAGEVAEMPMLLEDFLATVPWGSARKALEVIGPAFRMAHENGLIPSDPVPKITRPMPPKRRRKKEIPTPEEVEKMVVAAYEDDLWWGYFVDLTAALGTRRAETCALRWEDFIFPADGERYGWIRVRRALGKKKGGTYLKAPKSGLDRDLLVSASLFEGLEVFQGATGWLFPGRHVRPRKDRGELTPRSSPGRLLLWLEWMGGDVTCPSGRAGAEARRAIGVNSATMSQVSRALVEDGYLERDVNARRTFRLTLTTRGRKAAQALAREPDEDLPTHPDTAGHRFQAMVERLGFRGPSGTPYTLHSLRHFRATHLYNRSKDWVQVARYMGHTSPSITMDLYANNVIETTQALLADAAVRLVEDDEDALQGPCGTNPL